MDNDNKHDNDNGDTNDNNNDNDDNNTNAAAPVVYNTVPVMLAVR